MKQQLIKKLTSRKFWIMICNFVSMMGIAVGVTENEMVQITALIMAGGGIVAYLFAEGWVDASTVKNDE